MKWSEERLFSNHFVKYISINFIRWKFQLITNMYILHLLIIAIKQSPDLDKGKIGTMVCEGNTLHVRDMRGNWISTIGPENTECTLSGDNATWAMPFKITENFTNPNIVHGNDIEGVIADLKKLMTVLKSREKDRASPEFLYNDMSETREENSVKPKKKGIPRLSAEHKVKEIMPNAINHHYKIDDSNNHRGYNDKNERQIIPFRDTKNIDKILDALLKKIEITQTFNINNPSMNLYLNAAEGKGYPTSENRSVKQKRIKEKNSRSAKTESPLYMKYKKENSGKEDFLATHLAAKAQKYGKPNKNLLVKKKRKPHIKNPQEVISNTSKRGELANVQKEDRQVQQEVPREQTELGSQKAHNYPINRLDEGNDNDDNGESPVDKISASVPEDLENSENVKQNNTDYEEIKNLYQQENIEENVLKMEMPLETYGKNKNNQSGLEITKESTKKPKKIKMGEVKRANYYSVRQENLKEKAYKAKKVNNPKDFENSVDAKQKNCDNEDIKNLYQQKNIEEKVLNTEMRLEKDEENKDSQSKPEISKESTKKPKKIKLKEVKRANDNTVKQENLVEKTTKATIANKPKTFENSGNVKQENSDNEDIKRTNKRKNIKEKVFKTKIPLEKDEENKNNQTRQEITKESKIEPEEIKLGKEKKTKDIDEPENHNEKTTKGIISTKSEGKIKEDDNASKKPLEIKRLKKNKLKGKKGQKKTKIDERKLENFDSNSEKNKNGLDETQNEEKATTKDLTTKNSENDNKLKRKVNINKTKNTQKPSKSTALKNSGDFTPSKIIEILKKTKFKDNINIKYINAVSKGIKKIRKDQRSMFLAQLIHESAGLSAIEEIRCLDGKTCIGEYKDDIGLPGKEYHGRGFIQLTWGANYKAASNGLGMGDKLLQNPEIVSQNVDIAVNVSVWFWKNMVENDVGVLRNQFGSSTKVINGPLECGNSGSVVPSLRYELYKIVAEVMGDLQLASPDGCQ